MTGPSTTSLPPEYGYYKALLRGRTMPLAFVDLDCFDANVDAIAARCPNRSIRIASKSVRCVTLLQRILERNARYQGIMTYTPRETAFLAERGFDDFLMGYPAVNASDISELVPHIRAGKTIRFMVDCPAHVDILSRIAQSADTTFQLCIDLDMSSDFPGIHFGVRRSPVNAPDHALAIAARAKELPGVEVDALMGYEAQIAGLPDNVPGQSLKNRLFRFLKARSIAEISRRRTAVVDRLSQAGVELAVINGGGTGSIESTLQETSVTEVTVGSGFYSPLLFDGYQAFRHLPAAGYALEITRRPMPGIFTCQGGGYVASGALGPDKQPRPYLPKGAKLLPMEGGGEVQTPVAYDGPEILDLGDPILMRYAKAGEFCERFNSLVAIASGTIVGEYPTYRGEGRQFC